MTIRAQTGPPCGGPCSPEGCRSDFCRVDRERSGMSACWPTWPLRAVSLLLHARRGTRRRGVRRDATASTSGRSVGRSACQSRPAAARCASPAARMGHGTARRPTARLRASPSARHHARWPSRPRRLSLPRAWDGLQGAMTGQSAQVIAFPDRDRLLSVAEAAEVLQISAYTVRQWAREGEGSCGADGPLLAVPTLIAGRLG